MPISHLRRPNKKIISSSTHDQHPESWQVAAIYAALCPVHGRIELHTRAEVGQEHAVRRRLQTSRWRVFIPIRQGDLVSPHAEHERSCRDPRGQTTARTGRHARPTEEEVERGWHRGWYNTAVEQPKTDELGWRPKEQEREQAGETRQWDGLSQRGGWGEVD